MKDARYSDWLTSIQLVTGDALKLIRGSPSPLAEDATGVITRLEELNRSARERKVNYDNTRPKIAQRVRKGGETQYQLGGLTDQSDDC